MAEASSLLIGYVVLNPLLDRAPPPPPPPPPPLALLLLRLFVPDPPFMLPVLFLLRMLLVPLTLDTGLLLGTAGPAASITLPTLGFESAGNSSDSVRFPVIHMGKAEGGGRLLRQWTMEVTTEANNVRNQRGKMGEREMKAF